MPENRRSYARFPVTTTHCRAEVRGKQYHAFQLDMSTNGLGILGMGFESLEYGEPIIIRIGEEVIEGVCCRVNRADAGGLHIGIHRAENWYSRKNFHQHLLKRFVDCGGCEVPCVVISEDRSHALIWVSTGNPFKVPNDKLKSRTLGERVKTLSNDHQLARFLEYYNLHAGVTISNKDNCKLVDKVVDLEFVKQERKGPVPVPAGWECHPLSN